MKETKNKKETKSLRIYKGNSPNGKEARGEERRKKRKL